MPRNSQIVVLKMGESSVQPEWDSAIFTPARARVRTLGFLTLLLLGILWSGAVTAAPDQSDPGTSPLLASKFADPEPISDEPSAGGEDKTPAAPERGEERGELEILLSSNILEFVGGDAQPGLQESGDPRSITVGEEGYPTLAAAIAGAADGGTVFIPPGNHGLPRITIDKNLTLQALDSEIGEEAVVLAEQDTTNIGSTKNWIYIADNCQVHIQGLTFDGSGRQIFQAINAAGKLEAESCFFQNLGYGTLKGRAIILTADNSRVNNCQFANIGQTGILVQGAQGCLLSNNSYQGKGPGDHLEYGIEISEGAEVELRGNEIWACLGAVTQSGAKSAAVMISSSSLTNTRVLLAGNIIRGNLMGVIVGRESQDGSEVTFRGNQLTGNQSYSIYSTAPLIDARENYWGLGGPEREGANRVGERVQYCPWAIDTIDADGDGNFDHLVLPVELSWTAGGSIPQYIEGLNPGDHCQFSLVARITPRVPEQENLALILEWQRQGESSPDDILIDGQPVFSNSYLLYAGPLGNEPQSLSFTVSLLVGGVYEFSIYAIG